MRQFQLATSAFSAGRDTQQAMLGVLRLDVGGDRGVVGQQQAVLGAQDRHRAQRVHLAEGLTELLAGAQVHLHGLMGQAFLASKMRARRGLGAVAQS